MKKVLVTLLSSLLLHSISFAQKFDGVYQGSFSGDLEGSFTFTINHNYYNNLDGSFVISGGSKKVIIGLIKPDGKIDAYIFDKRSDITSALWKGTFTGTIINGKGQGQYELDDAYTEKPTTSKGTWTTGKSTKQPTGPMLSYTCISGKDLPFSEDKPAALRIHLSLNEGWRDDYSIQTVTMGARNPEQGRFAPCVDPIDNFYVYTNADGVDVTAKAGAKEADYTFESVHFGSKERLQLPKIIKTILYITLKNEKTGELKKETLNAEATISSLCTILVNKCSNGDCPSLNNKKLVPGKTDNAVQGDELVVPLDAELWVSFLDGTVAYFKNKSQTPWKLVMGAGHFSSNQSWNYTENALTIKAIASKSAEWGAEKTAEVAAEEGLKLLLKKSASMSAGLIVQITQFFAANPVGGEPVAIKLRSKLDVNIYANGTYRIANLEGSPEIGQKNSKPVLLPVGKQVSIDKKGVASTPEPVDRTTNMEVAKVPQQSWAGTWQTKWGKMTIVQNGNTVTGTYEHDKGKITGTVNGTILTGNWSEAPSYQLPDDAGNFEFVLSADGKGFTGRWRYGSKGAWQTGWDGVR